MLALIGHVSKLDLLRCEVFVQFVEHDLVVLSRYLLDDQGQIIEGVNVVAEVEFELFGYLEDFRCSTSVFLLE